ncbi:MAG: bifunctional diaminohydroxyphosphoribosylaminopyrimidine deaminase/5-amino-6-(5-phosphoribosylamino)uracil reductase RibD [Bifidobacteriaceae bacterium]|jgi:diaminohydroxyphosphoribosylaminopyrimidine deaminase/5-amino-6-(5-phosphoribosylamino)uracil reductase|nr:bifunctional diaminohydroxyphosphoribosylaminopyrimidine deaminase/5-amino-6-(5-phosphoribosylamino)uracil reductase RibD [Bifidobacteriaceae bacterium]
MDRAFQLAARGPKFGPNPRVGCVITGPDGIVLGEGSHQGAGTPHAEVAALEDARRRGAGVAGATVYVTLEPCNHHGRTGPCSRALVEAGVRKVLYALTDPNPAATGGSAYLKARGVEVEGDVDPGRALALNRAWAHSMTTGRPYVTLKLAASLDGRSAAADGSSQWITGAASRSHAHAKRAEVDAIMVGTGTFLADRPKLSARRPDGSLYEHQPLRVVVGERAINDPDYLHVRTHDPAQVLRQLASREIRHVLLEGGPGLATAFVRAGLVNQIDCYLAPALLGAGGLASLGLLGIESVDQALRWRTRYLERIGDDVFIEVGR